MYATTTQTIQQTLRRPVEVALVAVLLVPAMLAATNVALALQPANTAALPSNEERQLIEFTNQERVNHNQPVLRYNSQLRDAAMAKAADILEKDYFEHTSPQGKTPWVFIDQAGYSYLRAGENLAIDFKDSNDVVPAWMKSPTHRANILKDDYEEVGIAAVTGDYNGHKTTVVVQMFGSKPFSTQSITKTVVDSITSPLPF
jgi:uncharacterized protein YkwD